jgi:hypothetical protein
VSDDDAFRMLRTASMQTNQRLGQVSAHIIQSARLADSVNRSGQLRMLSQRLVKLYVLQLAGVQAAQHRQGLKESVQRIDANLAVLEKNVSHATHGDLLAQVVTSWGQLKRVAQSTPQVGQLLPLDDLAERLLQDAERLTGHLENAGATAPLRVLNLAGRQRMLSQRCAKLALLGAVGESTASQRWRDALADAQTEFDRTLPTWAGCRCPPPTSARGWTPPRPIGKTCCWACARPTTPWGASAWPWPASRCWRCLKPCRATTNTACKCWWADGGRRLVPLHQIWALNLLGPGAWHLK